MIFVIRVISRGLCSSVLFLWVLVLVLVWVCMCVCVFLPVQCGFAINRYVLCSGFRSECIIFATGSSQGLCSSALFLLGVGVGVFVCVILYTFLGSRGISKKQFTFADSTSLHRRYRLLDQVVYLYVTSNFR